jgi:hypothetical protein
MRWSANRSSPTGPAVCTTMDPRASMVHNHGSHGDLVGVPSSADRASSSNPHGRGPSWSSLDGRQIDHRRPGQHGAQPWIHGPAWCTTMDPRASMVHNHGSQGTWLEFDRVISADRASSSSPHGRGPGWSSLDGSQGTWLEFDRVIIAEPGQQQSPREGTWLEFDRVIIAEPGQQQQSPREGTWLEFPRWSANRSSPTGPAWCTTMDPRASMMHNHGSQGQHGAQPWVKVGRRVHTSGECRQTCAHIG